ncbi:MAG: SMI1/KNR4 family protein [Ruminococcus sp.]|nr:SMI1/KNR4 family protein [Ruminococcus sp.]
MDNSMYEIYKLYSETENEEMYPPATVEQIEKWERLHNVILPEEYKEFLLLSDGMRSYIFGGELFSLNEIIKCPPEEIEEYLDEQKDYFIIGNYIGDGSDLLCDREGNFYECDHYCGLEESDLLSFLEYWYDNK